MKLLSAFVVGAISFSLLTVGFALMGCGGPKTVHSVPKPPVEFSQKQADAIAHGEPKQVVKTLFPFLTIGSKDGQTVIHASQGGVYVIEWATGCQDDGGNGINCASDTVDKVDFYHS